MLRVAAGDFRRLEVGPDDAFRRAGLLDFGDDSRLTAGDLAADGADEIARRRLGSRRRFDGNERTDSQCRSDFLTLGGNDLVEDVARHYCANRCVH